LLGCLPNPRVGAQWNRSPTPTQAG
jgi:hypothetical protein